MEGSCDNRVRSQEKFRPHRPETRATKLQHEHHQRGIALECLDRALISIALS